MRLTLGALLLLLTAAACGGGRGAVQQTPASTAPPPADTTPATTITSDAQPTTLELFFLAPDGRLVADSRAVEHTQAPGGAALNELVDPPTGTTTEVPDGLQLTIDNGRAHISGPELNEAALAQVVYTLTAFPSVQTVDGKTRADVEDFVPAILVEHPAPGDTVGRRLHVSGTANTFEATFNYKLEDASGDVLAKDFVTASSGSGTRGTFEFDVPVKVDAAQKGTLSVFELSAEDGSVIHERVIPVQLSPA